MRRASLRASWGATIPDFEKLDHKLHHLRRVESSYRAVIRRAQQAMRKNTADPVKAKKKYEKIRAKYERKIEKLQPKVRHLISERAERKG